MKHILGLILLTGCGYQEIDVERWRSEMMDIPISEPTLPDYTLDPHGDVTLLDENGMPIDPYSRSSGSIDYDLIEAIDTVEEQDGI